MPPNAAKLCCLPLSEILFLRLTVLLPLALRIRKMRDYKNAESLYKIQVEFFAFASDRGVSSPDGSMHSGASKAGVLTFVETS